MKLLAYFSVLIFLFSCSQSNQQNETPQNISEETLPSFDEECIFDMSTQTDEFLKNNPLLKNFSWDNKNKIAKGLIANDSLQITRGGCAHFSFYGEITTKNIDTLDFKNKEFGFKKALEIVKIVFPKTDQEMFETLLKNHTYELEESNNLKSYFFKNEDYCSTTMYINKLPNGKYVLEIGYYIC